MLSNFNRNILVNGIIWMILNFYLHYFIEEASPTIEPEQVHTKVKIQFILACFIQGIIECHHKYVEE